VTAVVRAELLKVRTTRGWYGYLAAIVLLTGLGTAGTVGSAQDFERSFPGWQADLVDGAGFAAVISVILGITIVTTEFRHGTITPTMLVTPIRERVLAAKAAAAVLVAFGFFVLAVLVVYAVAVPWLAVLDVPLHLAEGDAFERGGQILLATALWALLGIAVGSLIQNQVAALVGTLVWILVVETLVMGLLNLVDLEGVVPYLPFRALDAADGTSGDDMLAFQGGVAVSAAYVAAIGVLGALRTNRRDIT
jgi:ABC-type transport system involved in multi-copper enzyme maturation permease subunit